MKAIAPGKLILSGEHAVVYGRPALAMAIDRSAQSIITTSPGELVSFELADFQSTESFTVRALRDMRDRVLRNYRLFLNGELGIRQVLYKPVELFEYMFINFLDGLHLKLNESVSIRTVSNIPIGCGLGSSAATVLSTARAVGHYFRVDFRPEWYYRYSIEAEKLQHGYPSGVDSFIAVNGGCALFQNEQATSVPLPRFNLYLVNTGTPETTTGECVVHVREKHEHDRIWNDFESVTRGFEQALRRNDMEEIRRHIRENNQLLIRIGVVPEKVQRFIASIEAGGGAAKIVGAGSVRGDNGGMVLVVDDRAPATLCKEYNYTITSVRGDPLGTRIID